jgi:hypothetical protein
MANLDEELDSEAIPHDSASDASLHSSSSIGAHSTESRLATYSSGTPSFSQNSSSVMM